MDGEAVVPFNPETFSENTPSPFACDGLKYQQMLSVACPFDTEVFCEVMMNLIKNPNITSTHLFRADIFYDSLNDASFALDTSDPEMTTFAKHMKKEYRPMGIDVKDFEPQRLVVRQLIPRNPQLDKPLVQTCYFLKNNSNLEEEKETEKTLVILLPHVPSYEQMPWYHPPIRGLAFLYAWHSRASSPTQPSQGRGNLSIHISTFSSFDSPASQTTTPNRLTRTLHNLLQTIHKHGGSRLHGYVKRVHHDLVIPQRLFQDTYTRLKTKYAKRLIGEWAEQTDPAKHVFEDLGIAAFCLELWRDMYRFLGNETDHGMRGITEGCPEERDGRPSGEGSKPMFPGFVDIGCGNGVLVYILLSEGYKGWGFDAQKRKTWNTFPPEVQAHLHQMALVPSVFLSLSTITTSNRREPFFLLPTDTPRGKTQALDLSAVIAPPENAQHSFIISNHADELSPWTPLLAYLASSPFMCIPCCSHDLSGARYRFPPHKSEPPNTQSSQGAADSSKAPLENSNHKQQKQASPPSAYSSLVAYVESLARELGFATEREMLRIPSTRNACVIGWQSSQRTQSGRLDEIREIDIEEGYSDQREDTVRKIIERELGKGLNVAAGEWKQKLKVLLAGEGRGRGY